MKATTKGTKRKADDRVHLNKSFFETCFQHNPSPPGTTKPNTEDETEDQVINPSNSQIKEETNDSAETSDSTTARQLDAAVEDDIKPETTTGSEVGGLEEADVQDSIEGAEAEVAEGEGEGHLFQTARE
ncbi:uncharacterized protein LTR77_003137 [Saxophila tyrrhenica]|uniref:Uncharacterized protein n=1 Tax=Saxophila tyrrhenica TaxID=1690608 RepID=A0AAV9PK52_9PEZI|nr:hypothetical protein LTR77_003137 [Saxophila tyrrhenica]